MKKGFTLGEENIMYPYALQEEDFCHCVRSQSNPLNKPDSFGKPLERGKCNEILRSLHSLRMTWGKGVNVFTLSLGEGKRNLKELINLSTYPLINFNKIYPRPLRERARERGKKAAFTLAETLITLGIIGVVAAITIPGLINNYKAHRLRAQFLKSYSTIHQVFKQMEADDVSLDPSTYAHYGFSKLLVNYLNAAVYCGSEGQSCYKKAIEDDYKSYNNVKNRAFHRYMDDGVILLSDGTTLFMENQGNKGATTGVDIAVTVDINGYNTLPNRFGYDTFMFELVDGELRTMGDKKTLYNDLEKYCSINSTEPLNGVACAHKAKTDSDYFKIVVKNFK